MRPDGDLGTCAYCGAALGPPVDGSDPDDAGGEFRERYGYPNGHVGRCGIVAPADRPHRLLVGYSYHVEGSRERG